VNLDIIIILSLVNVKLVSRFFQGYNILAKAEIYQARFSKRFCCSFIATEVRIERLANDSVVRYNAKVTKDGEVREQEIPKGG